MKHLIFFFSLAISLIAECTNIDIAQYAIYKNHTYAISKNDLTYAEALALANSHQGYLSIPDNKDENDFLISKNWSGFIGIYDPDNLPTYCMNGVNCVSSDTRFTTYRGNLVWTNWATNEPNNIVYTQDMENNISPLGENWTILKANGEWESVGNHYFTNPYKAKAIIEINQELECAGSSTGVESDGLPTNGYWCSDDNQLKECTCAGTVVNGNCETWAYANKITTTTSSSYGASSSTSRSIICGYANASYLYPDYNRLNPYAMAGECGFTPTGMSKSIVGVFYYKDISSGYTCPSGGSLSGTTCTITTTTITCPSGYSDYGSSTQCRVKKIIPFTCPLGAYNCVNFGDSSNIEAPDTTRGENDKKADGTVSEDGSCSGNFYIFNGKDERCREKDIFFGLNGGGCCDKDKVFFGLVGCKPEEKYWAESAIAGKTHLVGSYCAKKIKFIGCILTKQTHCTFNSKLARIIHEEGRPQINLSWGTPESPTCRGFTPEEFQRLDFSKIDLSEFVADIQAKVSNFANLGSFVSDKVNNFLQQ